jgi:serine/threonine-protein kinase
VALPPAFDAWFQRATAVEPSARFQRASEAVQALAVALGSIASVQTAAFGTAGRFASEPSFPPPPHPTSSLPPAMTPPQLGSFTPVGPSAHPPTAALTGASTTGSGAVARPLIAPTKNRAPIAVIGVLVTVAALALGGWLVLSASKHGTGVAAAKGDPSTIAAKQSASAPIAVEPPPSASQAVEPSPATSASAPPVATGHGALPANRPSAGKPLQKPVAAPSKPGSAAVPILGRD